MLKSSKISTMPSHHGGREFIASPALIKIFNDLKEIVSPYARTLEPRINTNIQYELWTRHAFRTKSFRPKTQKGLLFTGFAICRQHVGLYFYPLHANEAIRYKVPPGLTELLKGESTFHIKNLDDALIEDIKALFEIGWNEYSIRGWVSLKDSAFVIKRY